MKGSRTPVIVDVLYSFEWFLLAASACLPFACERLGGPAAFCIRLLPAALLYIVVALITRLVRQPALRAALPFAASVGCVFTAQNTAQRVVLIILSIIAIICGFFIHFCMRKGSSRYNEMFIALPVLAVLAIILRKLEMHPEVSLVNVFMAIFLPICAAIWYINRFADSMSIFTLRADQPIDRISKRMYRTIGTVVLLVLFATLLIPQSNGVNLLVSLIETGIAGIFAIIILIADLFAVPYTEGLADEFAVTHAQPLDMGEESIWDVYLLYALAAIILIILAISAVSMLIKLIRYLFNGFMRYDGNTAPESSGNDTVEKIERRRENRSKERLGKTNAGRIRRIYKKRVSAVLGDSLGRLSSYTPNEIAALCRKKGEDITELTKLYKKARYTNSCTENDVKKAKQL